MSYLSINGIPFSIAQNSAQQNVQLIGGRARAITGDLWVLSSGFKSTWTMRTPPMSKANAQALVGLLGVHSDGVGDALTCEFLNYTVNGRSVTLANDAAMSTTYAKYGTYSLKIPYDAGKTNTATIATGWDSTSYSVFFWCKNSTGAWIHYAKTYDGSNLELFVAGVHAETSAYCDCVTYSSGTFTFAEHTSADIYFDDVLMLPFAAPGGSASTWPAALAGLTAQITAPPVFTVSSDALINASASVHVVKIVDVDVSGTVQHIIEMEIVER